ncbi:TPA: hypothetical protein ACGJZV_006437, partial [Pseudomonas aeruginosa]
GVRCGGLRDACLLGLMKVISASPQFWHLLEEQSDLILTVSCEHSFIGYDFTMKLNPDERSKYAQGGDSYISQLAEAINYSCPIARGSASVYKDRNIDAQYSKAILRTIEKWSGKRHG